MSSVCACVSMLSFVSVVRRGCMHSRNSGEDIGSPCFSPDRRGNSTVNLLLIISFALDLPLSHIMMFLNCVGSLASTITLSSHSCDTLSYAFSKLRSSGLSCLSFWSSAVNQRIACSVVLPLTNPVWYVGIASASHGCILLFIRFERTLQSQFVSAIGR